nr:MAG: RNA polymerase sigma factor [Caldicoprobacter oshimai]
MTDGRVPTDEELWWELQQGSQAALELLVRRYHAPLFGYAWRLTRDYHAAQDLVQETFYRLLRQGHAVRQPGALRRWLYRVLTRLALDWKKAAARREVAAEDAARWDGNDPAARRPRVVSLVEALEQREDRRRLAQALARLPEPQRIVVFLRFYEDLPLRDIAEVLDIPLGTVKSRLHKALKALHALLGQEQGTRTREGTSSRRDTSTRGRAVAPPPNPMGSPAAAREGDRP